MHYQYVSCHVNVYVCTCCASAALLESHQPWKPEHQTRYVSNFCQFLDFSGWNVSDCHRRTRFSLGICIHHKILIKNTTCNMVQYGALSFSPQIMPVCFFAKFPPFCLFCLTISLRPGELQKHSPNQGAEEQGSEGKSKRKFHTIKALFQIFDIRSL